LVGVAEKRPDAVALAYRENDAQCSSALNPPLTVSSGSDSRLADVSSSTMVVVDPAASAWRQTG
jgi:hypothetical protein